MAGRMKSRAVQRRALAMLVCLASWSRLMARLRRVAKQACLGADGSFQLKFPEPHGPLPGRGMTPNFFATPAEFRAWLEEHNDKTQELWVGFYKKSSGKLWLSRW